MKYLHYAANVGATLVLGLAIARIFGSISFSPRATELLVRCAASLGIYGDSGSGHAVAVSHAYSIGDEEINALSSIRRWQEMQRM